tara:strand:- start:3896 stop:4438 length:543 start_codon:yes stop_codon:yes gene_type:complete
MNKLYKEGDEITVNGGPYTDVTFGQKYIVTSISDDCKSLRIVDDNADRNWIKWSDCSHHLADNDIDRAKGLVGKNVRLTGEGEVSDIEIYAWSVWNKFQVQEDNGHDEITRLIERDGYCVTVEDEDGYSHTLTNITVLTNRIKLNAEYTAVIKGNDVVVGCQTIPIEKVKEIIKRHEDLN